MEKKQTPTKNSVLRQAREERGWTQRHLADAIEMDEETVRSWERGIRIPSLDARSRLCAALEKTPEQLGLQKGEPITPYPLSSHVVQKEPEKRNRTRMLQRVSARWITGILEHSLHHAAFILLGLREEPEALANPWRLAVAESDLPPRPLPFGTRITQVYDSAGGELLILGEPGAGKTTLLLDLARDLLKRAEQDEDHPIPVIFNLSSWAVKQMTLTEWLVEELHTKYWVPRSVGQEWIATNLLIVLLDGLDEVAEVARPACVKALNIFQQQHVLVPIVVCCRRAEYFAQGIQVTLQQAVLIQPLTAQQIDDYIAAAGRQLAGVRKALSEDSELQEMATPLMLSIIALAYQGESRATLGAVGSLEDRRQQIFAAYVQRMLCRRGIATHYTQEQTIHYLAWLGRQLARHNQTEFYIERMQPGWLPDNQSQERYRRTIVRLIFGVQIIVSAGLFAWLRGGDKAHTIPGVGIGLLGALGSGPGNTLLGWMAPGLGGGPEGGGSLGVVLALVLVLVTLLVRRRGTPSLSVKDLARALFHGIRNGLTVGAIVGLFSGCIFALNGGLGYGVYRGFGTGLFSGLLTGLMTGLISGMGYGHEGPHFHRPLDRLLDILLFSLCATLSNGGVYMLLAGQLSLNVVIYGSIIGFFFGIAFGIGGGTDLIRGLGTEIQPAETVAWSWHNVGLNFVGTIRKSLVVGLSVMPPVIVAISSSSGLFRGVPYGLRYGLIYGLIIGLVGGVAVILTDMLNNGWSSQILAEHQLFRPNEGIRRSLANATFAALLFGPIGGLASGLICGLAFGVIGGLPGWPILGVGFAIVFGIVFALQFLLTHGGIASLEHYVLRWYLWRSGVIPLNYIAFLDYAAERILLCKVGGGYMFIHRLLIEYFASLNPSDRDVS